MSRRNKALPEDEDVAQDAPLTPLQSNLIAELMAGHTVTDSALLAGTSRRTACRWLEEGPVRNEYERQRLARLQQVRDRSSSLHDLALKTLEDSLAASEPMATRIASARFILERNMGNNWTPTADELTQKEEKSEIDAQQRESNLRLDRMLLNMQTPADLLH